MAAGQERASYGWHSTQHPKLVCAKALSYPASYELLRVREKQTVFIKQLALLFIYESKT